MNVNRIIPVHHDNPLASFQEFLAAWWSALDLQAMLAPFELSDRSSVITQPIEHASQLVYVNPFAPIMQSNAAALVNAFVRDRAGQRLAVMLRPCELRALIELRKRRRTLAVDEALANHTLIIIGVDCVATYPVAEYTRRIQEYSEEAVTHDALMYAGEAVYSPYDLRAVCKVCDWPAPRAADVTIGVIGVAAEHYLLVIAQDEDADVRWRLNRVTTGLATDSQAAQREAAVNNLSDERAAARTQQLGLVSENGMDFARVLGWISNCTLCGDCLDACPLYNGELARWLGAGAHRNNHALLADFIEVARWLTSCSGCGMCEAACEQGVPLGLIASALSHGIRGGLHHYVAGDPDRSLPWASAGR